MAAFAQPGFTVSIIVDGKPIREQSENGTRTVRIPFGTEYKIRLKNKTNNRAYATIDIDGTSIMQIGQKLILSPKQTVDIERFITNGDMLAGKKLKFVEEGHAEVSDPGSEDNGGIVVTFHPEVVNTLTVDYSGILGASGSSAGGASARRINVDSYNSSINCSGSTLTATSIGAQYTTNNSNSISDVGATIEGSHSSQSFEKSNEWFMTGTPVKIAILLKGNKLQPEKNWQLSMKTGTLTHKGCELEIKSFEFDDNCLVLRVPIDRVSVSLI